MKVRCIRQFKTLEGVLDEGDEVDLISTNPNDEFDGYSFVSKDGNTYTSKTLFNVLGYFMMNSLFLKI